MFYGCSSLLHTALLFTTNVHSEIGVRRLPIGETYDDSQKEFVRRAKVCLSRQ